jgi:hypothetical protein
LGPALTTARSIVSVVVVQNRLYAIGGFSGKKFLNTIEYYDADAKEWTKFAKLQQPSTNSHEHDDEEPLMNGNGKVPAPTNGEVKKEAKVKTPTESNGTHSNGNGKISEDESDTIIMPRPVC